MNGYCNSSITSLTACTKCLFLALIVWFNNSHAEIYFWKDAKGTSHYSDRALVGADSISVQPGYAYYRIKKVFDGDTVLLDDDAKVRLLGINTPEIESSKKGEEPVAAKAKQYLQSLIAGKKVRLETDAVEYDKYQRKLAHLFTEDGEHLNLILVEQGLATVNIHPPNLLHLERLIQAQQVAEKRSIGIWSENHYRPRPIEMISESRRGWQRLVGKPRTIREGRKYTRLQFSDNINVRIPKENLTYFPDLHAYLDKKVEVRGWISKRKEEYSILIRHPSALIMGQPTLVD